MNFEQITSMLSGGIVGTVKPKTPAFFPFGFRGGAYLGAPGKDLYFALPNLSDQEFNQVAKQLAALYPKKPPTNHVKWAACIRYVYGCFEKQGCLRSDDDKARMVEEDPDWSLPITFMEEVAKNFALNKQHYGLVIHYEMLAHRWGDRSIIKNNPSDLETMLDLYRKAQELALRIKSWKHTFTPFFWAAGYLGEMNDPRAVDYYKLNLKMMEKYCPDARDGYREKVRTSLRYIKKHLSNSDWKGYYAKYKKFNNRCLKKVRI